MKKKKYEVSRYWMLLILDIALLFLFATWAVIIAIHAADFKMNVIYPNMCSCQYPVGSLSDAQLSECKSYCAEMRSDERSLTIGFLSICLFYFFQTLYQIIKRRLGPIIIKYSKTKRFKY